MRATWSPRCLWPLLGEVRLSWIFVHLYILFMQYLFNKNTYFKNWGKMKTTFIHIVLGPRGVLAVSRLQPTPGWAEAWGGGRVVL